MAPKLNFETVNNGDKLPEITRHITQEVMWQHAVTSFDWNPVHVHPEWCKKAQVFGLESTVMHGSLMFCLITSVVTNWSYAAGGRMKKLEVKLISPVPPDSAVTLGGEVIEKHPVARGKDFVVVEIYGKTQNEKQFTAARAEVILP
jgi:acyl dehydratase